MEKYQSNMCKKLGEEELHFKLMIVFDPPSTI